MKTSANISQEYRKKRCYTEISINESDWIFEQAFAPNLNQQTIIHNATGYTTQYHNMESNIFGCGCTVNTTYMLLLLLHYFTEVK